MARGGTTSRRVAACRALPLLLACCAPGCYHLIEPIKPVSLEVEEGGLFDPGLCIQTENGYEEPVIQRLRKEGIHHLVIDLRDWTGRIAAELALELKRRNVSATVVEGSLVGTSLVGTTDALLEASPDPSCPRLTVWIGGVIPPSPVGERGPRMFVELESNNGFHAYVTTDSRVKTFDEAFLDLKRQLLLDERFREWVASPATQ